MPSPPKPNYERIEKEHHEAVAKWCREIESQWPLVIREVREGWQGKNWDSRELLDWLYPQRRGNGADAVNKLAEENRC